jgi:ATP-dependent Clp protease adapter protein ClpS
MILDNGNLCNFDRILKKGIMDDPKQKRSRELRRDQLFEEEFNDILESLGITLSEEFNLILHNDNINSFIDVVVALFEVCKLSNEKSFSVMMEAHTNGRSIVRNGSLDELHYMKINLQSKGLTVSLEHAE